MKKTSKTQIIKWYKSGLSVDEFAPLIPQYCRQEIEAVIRAYEKEEAWCRLMHGQRS
nr:MAG: hypothetical protein [Bacteriophage sp.]